MAARPEVVGDRVIRDQIRAAAKRKPKRKVARKPLAERLTVTGGGDFEKRRAAAARHDAAEKKRQQRAAERAREAAGRRARRAREDAQRRARRRREVERAKARKKKRPARGRPAHPHDTCRDTECARPLCVAHRDGYEEGYADGQRVASDA